MLGLSEDYVVMSESMLLYVLGVEIYRICSRVVYVCGSMLQGLRV